MPTTKTAHQTAKENFKFSDYTVFTILYIGFFSFSYLNGAKVWIPFGDMHYIERAQLETNLLQSIWYLHSQPPLLNFTLGLYLWLQKTTGIKIEYIILVIQFLMGGIIVSSIAYLAQELIKNRYISIALITLFLLNPVFYATIVVYHYTIFELFILSLLACYINFSFKDFKDSTIITIYILICALVYTRALFHFLWGILLILYLVYLYSKKEKIKRVRIIIYSVAAIILLLAWPIKNYILFDSFSYSSWQGYNLSEGVPLEKLPTPNLFSHQLHLSPEEKNLLIEEVPAKFREIPILSMPIKSDGHANMNHYSIIGTSKKLQEESLRLFSARPELLLWKMGYFYLNGYTTYEGRNPYNKEIWMRPPTVLFWMWAKSYETLMFQKFGEDSTEFLFDKPSGFFFVFQLIIIASSVLLIRNWNVQYSETKTISILLFITLWVLALALLGGYEANRMKFSTEPYILILAGWSFSKIKKSRNKDHSL